MPFSLKKSYGSNQQCIRWVELGGHFFASVTEVGVEARIYDDTGVIIKSTPGIFQIEIFIVAGKLFIGQTESGSYVIYRWDGSTFVYAAIVNSKRVMVDFTYYNNNLYILLAKNTVVTNSTLYKFTGANSGGISIVKDADGMTSFDIDQATGNIYIGYTDIVSVSKIIRKNFIGGAESDVITFAGGSNGIKGIRIFDNKIHYLRSTGVSVALCKLDTFSPGAVETQIQNGYTNSFNEYGRMIISILFDSLLWFRVNDKVYQYSTGTPPILFDTLVGYNTAYNNEFTDMTTELILGAKSKFLTTALVCDLAPGIPAYTKTDETATDANDGSITVHATSSFYIQYSLDNVTFQSSNLFINLAPGSYNVYLKDSKGCTQEIDNVIILEFNAPEPPDPPTGTELVIDMRPVNSKNFISWFNSTGDTGFDHVSTINCINGIPNGYLTSKLPNAPFHYPYFVNAEQFSFYLNFDQDYSYPNFSSLRLCLINKYGLVQANVAQLYQVMNVDGVSYFIYANVTLAGVNPGVYRLAIVDSSNSNAIVFVSNDLKCITTTNANKKTGKFVYKNSVNIYRFLYESIPDFTHQIRLMINGLEDNVEGQLDQYRSVSSGKLRNVNVELDRVIKIETYYFDRLAHAAVGVMQVHDYIFINGISYLVKNLYKPDWSNPAKATFKGILEIYEQDFSMSNRYGTKDNIVIVGSDDPVLLGDDDGFIKL